MKHRGLSLVDVLAAALVRPDTRCGPAVLALWAGPEWLVLQEPDVQQQAQQEPAPLGEVPVILGISTGTRGVRLSLKRS